jgi:hypothetical protein
MKRATLFLLLGILVIKVDAQTSKPQYVINASGANNTGIPVFSDSDKGVIEALNWVRQSPKQFITKVLLNPDFERFVPASERDGFYNSLIKDLYSMEPIRTSIIFNDELYGYAECHARTSGELGVVSHERVNSVCGKGFRAECIAYGPNNPLLIVFNLLVDEGNPDLGHRRILLSDKFTKAGASIQPHSTYRYNCVIDLK